MTPKPIIICDDDEGIVDVASIVLKEAGYDVTALTESKDVLETALRVKPKLILLDLWMPNFSGEDVTKILRKNEETSQIPIVIVSASRHTEVIAKQIGADHFLCKPFDIEELESVVKQYTE